MAVDNLHLVTCPIETSSMAVMAAVGVNILMFVLVGGITVTVDSVQAGTGDASSSLPLLHLSVLPISGPS